VVFLGFSIIAKTALQKNPTIGINVRTILQPNTYYTCPAGKVATVKGRVVCTGLGAAAEARFLIDGVITYRWQANNTGISLVLVDNTSQIQQQNSTLVDPPINTYREFQFTLNAGESFSTDQSSGTNAEFNVFAEVTENPA